MISKRKDMRMLTHVKIGLWTCEVHMLLSQMILRSYDKWSYFFFLLLMLFRIYSFFGDAAAHVTHLSS